MIEGRISEVEIAYSGEIAGQDTSSLSMALVRGLLEPVVKEAVNYINAMPVARSRGIQIKESKTALNEEFTNLVSLTIKTDKETRSCAATLSSKREPRIVKIDDFYLEAVPKGYLLVMKNRDVPGIIGTIGTLMGTNRINIASMVCGRTAAGDVAVNVVNVDSPIPADLLEQIRRLDNILAAKLVKL